MDIKFLTVSSMILVLCSSTTAWNFTIIRNSTKKLTSSVVDSIDTFNISGCIGNEEHCLKFGGQKLQDRCQCGCNQDKSTFGYYNRKWGCTENSIVRQHAACVYYLQRPGGQGKHDPFFTLPVLGGHTDSNYVQNIPLNTSCKVIAAKATFLKCDGTWGILTESNVNRKLRFQDKKLGSVFIGPYDTSSPEDPFLDGRVIRIPIKCEGRTWNLSQCLTLKIKGQILCTNSSGSTRDVHVSPVVSTDTTRTPTTTNHTGNIGKSEEDNPQPSVALIAGSVVGGVVFVILIVVIILLVIWSKRRGKAKAKEKIIRTQENLAYEQGPNFSIALQTRPLPEPPSQVPYENIQRVLSTNIQHPNGTGPRDLNEEPLYGEIDDTYSRLDHQLIKSRNSVAMLLPNELTFDPSPAAPRTMDTLKSGDGSEIDNFEKYDVVGGEIKSSLPRVNTLKSAGESSIGRESNSSYDVPKSMIRSWSKERPQNGILGNATAQAKQRDMLNSGNYETVWDDNDDNSVARIA